MKCRIGEREKPEVVCKILHLQSEERRNHRVEIGRWIQGQSLHNTAELYYGVLTIKFFFIYVCNLKSNQRDRIE